MRKKSDHTKRPLRGFEQLILDNYLNLNVREVDPSEVIFDQDCLIEHEQIEPSQIALFLRRYYKVDENTKGQGAGFSDLNLEWTLGGESVAIPNDNLGQNLISTLFPLLKEGDNLLELKAFRNNELVQTLLINLKKAPPSPTLDDFRIRAYVNGQEKQNLYRHFEVIGDKENGEIPIKPGDRVELELLMLNEVGQWVVMESTSWLSELETEPIVQTRYNKTMPDLGLRSLTINAENQQAPNDFQVMLRFEFEFSQEFPLPPTQFFTIDISDEIHERQHERKDRMYATALEKIREKNPEIYNLFSGNSYSIFIYLVPASNEALMSVDEGVLVAQSGGLIDKISSNYPLLGIKDLIADDDTPLTIPSTKIIKNATLVSKLREDQIDQIKIAVDLQTETEQFQEIYELILSVDPLKANQLKTQILAGTLPNDAFLGGIEFKVRLQDLKYYVTIGDSPLRIHLNNTEIRSNQSMFTENLAHELAHFSYPIFNPLEAIKWDVIREKSNEENNYDLEDGLLENIANGFCSSLDDHEKNNPENKYICKKVLDNY